MSVSRETAIARYIVLLERWGSALNLTSAAERLNLRSHVDLCLQISEWLPRGTDRLVDLGSGQGFPAIPLAIATGISIEMIEADRRKAAFLQTVLAQLDLAGTVHPVRFADARVAPAPCVTARALAPLSRLIPMAAPFLSSDGTFLFMKGAGVHEELAQLEPGFAEKADVIPLHPAPSCLVKLPQLR